VVVHEWGHYIAGKRAGIKVLEFSIGFGPAIYKRMKGETQFSIRFLPIGGYCRFFGDDEEEAKLPGAFNHASVPQRLWTFVAGPAMNFLLAFILAVTFLCAFGDYRIYIDSVNPGSPAQVAGLKQGDMITELNGVKVDFLMDMYEAKQNTQGQYSETTVVRDGKAISVKMPYNVQADGTKLIGISMVQVPRTYSFFEAVGSGVTWMFDLTKQMLVTLGALIFAGQGVQNLAGPVGTISIIGIAIKSGMYYALQIAALISLNLAIINLLPFPALDGGQIVLLGVEAVRRKPVPMRVIGVLNTIGLVIIFGFAIYLTFQDVTRLTGG
jgi:regulator of sigma E protease